MKVVLDSKDESTSLYNAATDMIPVIQGDTGERVVKRISAQNLLAALPAATTKATITLAQSMTVAQMTAAPVIVITGAVAAFDGGGGLYVFDASGIAADNGSTTLRPSDFNGTTKIGNLRKV
jgi:hypothetical protein